MSNDVSTNPFDEGPKREEKNTTKTVEFDQKNYLNTRLDGYPDTGYRRETKVHNTSPCSQP